MVEVKDIDLAAAVKVRTVAPPGIGAFVTHPVVGHSHEVAKIYAGIRIEIGAVNYLTQIGLGKARRYSAAAGETGHAVESIDVQVCHADRPIKEQFDLETVAVGYTDLRYILICYDYTVSELLIADPSARRGVQIVEQRRHPSWFEMCHDRFVGGSFPGIESNGAVAVYPEGAIGSTENTDRSAADQHYFGVGIIGQGDNCTVDRICWEIADLITTELVEIRRTVRYVCKCLVVKIIVALTEYFRKELFENDLNRGYRLIRISTGRRCASVAGLEREPVRVAKERIGCVEHGIAAAGQRIFDRVDIDRSCQWVAERAVVR